MNGGNVWAYAKGLFLPSLRNVDNVYCISNLRLHVSSTFTCDTCKREISMGVCVVRANSTSL